MTQRHTPPYGYGAPCRARPCASVSQPHISLPAYDGAIVTQSNS